jgi:8-oxo-dGTP pyrophosphatase MutT (NUDIX family)
VQASPEISDDELLCPECEYNLTGSTSDRCTWCGWTIDVQELVAANISRHTATRLSVAVAAFIVAIGTTIALMALYTRGRQLGWRDALAVLTVFVVAVAHVSLAVAVLRAPRPWPMRAGEASNVFRVIGWGSIAASFVAATPLLYAAPSPLVVKGVQVNGVLEFVMTAVFFSLPGVMLLVLRLVSYRQKGHGLWLSKSRIGGRSGPPFIIEVNRRYEIEQLSQTWSDAPRPSAPGVEEMIARTWEAESAVAQEEGRKLFNGRVGRLVELAASDAALSFRLGDTCYRDFLGTNLFHAAQVARLSSSFLANALGISALVLTRDGFAALGRRSRKVVIHAELLHTFGGLLEEADRTAQGYDLVKSIKRELEEELGVGPADLSAIAVIGLVRDRAIQQPELIFEIILTLTRNELIAKFGASHDDEHTSLEFVADDPDAAVAFLRQTSKITPVAQVALLLHGKYAWGTPWYEQSCFALYGQRPNDSLSLAGRGLG